MGKQQESERITCSNSDLLLLLQEVFESGGSFDLTITGTSMEPTLRHLIDQVRLVSVNVRKIAENDILFFIRGDGQYVLHRLIRKEKDIYVMNGDAQNWTELIRPEQTLAVVSAICRKGKWISVNSPGYRLYIVFWKHTRKIRPLIFRILRVTRPFRKALFYTQ